MDAHELARQLLAEPEGTQVFLVSPSDQGDCYDFALVSQRTGVSQIPAPFAYLAPDLTMVYST